MVEYFLPILTPTFQSMISSTAKTRFTIVVNLFVTCKIINYNLPSFFLFRESASVIPKLPTCGIFYAVLHRTKPKILCHSQKQFGVTIKMPLLKIIKNHFSTDIRFTLAK